MTRRRRWLLREAVPSCAYLVVAVLCAIFGDWVLAVAFAGVAGVLVMQASSAYHLYRAAYFTGVRDAVASTIVGTDLVQRDPHPADVLGDRHGG